MVWSSSTSPGGVPIFSSLTGAGSSTFGAGSGAVGDGSLFTLEAEAVEDGSLFTLEAEAEAGSALGRWLALMPPLAGLGLGGLAWEEVLPWSGGLTLWLSGQCPEGPLLGEAPRGGLEPPTFPES